ncbi:MAG: hypothetical protein HZA90_07155 [Verrucomicrobia bacterium]|nr:hypothetical protein [Verrucomicrobiota bacterium]
MPENPELRVHYKTTADNSGAASAAQAHRDVAAASQQAAEAAKEQAAAEKELATFLGVVDAELEKKGQAEIEQQQQALQAALQFREALNEEAEVQAKASDETGKTLSLKKLLVQQVKILSHALGQIPGAWQVMAIVKNPYVALAVALGTVVAKFREFKQAVDEAALAARAGEDFIRILRGSVELMAEASIRAKSLADRLHEAARGQKQIGEQLAHSRTILADYFARQETVASAREKRLRAELDLMEDGLAKTKALAELEARLEQERQQRDLQKKEAEYGLRASSSARAKEKAAELGAQAEALQGPAVGAAPGTVNYQIGIIAQMEADAKANQPLWKKAQDKAQTAYNQAVESQAEAERRHSAFMALDKSSSAYLGGINAEGQPVSGVLLADANKRLAAAKDALRAAYHEEQIVTANIAAEKANLARMTAARDKLIDRQAAAIEAHKAEAEAAQDLADEIQKLTATFAKINEEKAGEMVAARLKQLDEAFKKAQPGSDEQFSIFSEVAGLFNFREPRQFGVNAKAPRAPAPWEVWHDRMSRYRQNEIEALEREDYPAAEAWGKEAIRLGPEPERIRKGAIDAVNSIQNVETAMMDVLGQISNELGRVSARLQASRGPAYS